MGIRQSPIHVLCMHSGPCANQFVLGTARGSVQTPLSGTSTQLGWTRHNKAKCGDGTREYKVSATGVQEIERPHTAGNSKTSLPRNRPSIRASNNEEEVVPWVQLMVRSWKQLSEGQRWATLPGPLALL